MVDVPVSGPAPAGPAAARAGAAAASVVCAAARGLAAGAAAAQAVALAERLQRLADLDAEVYGVALEALAALADGGSDARRDFALGRALDRAAAVPLEIAEACADVAALARTLAPSPDAEAAAELAVGAARAAAHLVEINLAVLPDDERVVRARAAAAG